MSHFLIIDLISFTGSRDTLKKVITASADPDARIIFGTIVDETMSDEIRVTVIATGFVPVSREIALEVVASSFPGRFREINTRAFEAGFSAISAAMRG